MLELVCIVGSLDDYRLCTQKSHLLSAHPEVSAGAARAWTDINALAYVVDACASCRQSLGLQSLGWVYVPDSYPKPVYCSGASATSCPDYTDTGMVASAPLHATRACRRTCLHGAGAPTCPNAEMPRCDTHECRRRRRLGGDLKWGCSLRVP